MGRTKDYSAMDTAIKKKPPAPDVGGNTTPQAKEPLTKGLTVKLTETEYQRLRNWAFANQTTHQATLRTALMEYLERQGG